VGIEPPRLVPRRLGRDRAELVVRPRRDAETADG